MIEQLWYTWSSKGLGSITGYRVRAASPQLATSPRLSALETHLSYLLPQGANPVTTNPLDAPLCLAFLKDKDEQGQERGILINKRYIGQNERGRPGNYFAHLLTSLPQNFSARQAMSYWKSPFWQVDDASHPNDTTLPQISETDLAVQPGERPDITKALPALPFVIQAFLTRGEKQRIYVADVPERVAALVLALTESLPLSLLEPLTFSTYERDFAQSPALLVGTYWTGIEQPTSQDLLPAVCYASDKGPALAINGYSQRQSPLPVIPALDASLKAFARYATAHFSQPNDLLTIRAIAERYPQLGLPEFLGLADFYTGLVNLAQLTADHLTTLLQIVELATSFLKRDETQRSLLAQIELPTQWWTQTGRSLIKTLAERYNTGEIRVGLIGLAMKAVGRVVALQANRQPEAERWVQLIWDVAPPAVASEPWVALLNSQIASWWIGGGRLHLKRLAEHHNTGDIHVGLIGLAMRAVNAVVAALQANKQSEAESWVQLIWDVASPDVTADPWVALLNTRIATGAVRASWSLRYSLLSAWNIIASRQPGAVDVALLRAWLEIASWDEFKELLKLSLPFEWYKISLEKLLGSPMGGPAQGIPQNDTLEKMLKKFMETPQEQTLGIMLFARLAQGGYLAKPATIAAILKQLQEQPLVAALFLRIGSQRWRTAEVGEMVTKIPARWQEPVLLALFLADAEWGPEADTRRLQEMRAQMGQGATNETAWLFSAPGWWNQTGNTILPHLGGSGLALAALGKQAKQWLIQAIQLPYEPMLPFLVEVLTEVVKVQKTVAASGAVPDPWQEIWEQVYKLQKPLSWPSRFKLLEKWKDVERLKHEDHLSVWLMLTWAEVDASLWMLPVQWQQLALFSLVRGSLSQPLAYAISALTLHSTQLEPLVVSLLVYDAQNQPLVVPFFAQVAVQGNYARKLPLLSALLNQAQGNLALLEALLQAAQITPEELPYLIEQYSAPLLAAPALPQTYLLHAQAYLAGLTTPDAARLRPIDYQPIRQLGAYAYRKPGNATLAAAFKALLERAKEQAPRMLKQGIEEPAAFLLDMLAVTVELTRQNEEWLHLLRAAKQPGPGISPDLRLVLGYYWADFEEQVGLEEIRPWLQIDWQTAYTLIQGLQKHRLPERWCLEVFLGLIARQQAPLSVEEARMVTTPTHFRWVATAMREAVKDADKREQVVVFLGALAQAKIHFRMYLLRSLLVGVASDLALAERMWQAANVSREQREWFRKYYLQQIQAVKSMPPGFLSWLEQKLGVPAQAGGKTAAPTPTKEPEKKAAALSRRSHVKGFFSRLVPFLKDRPSAEQPQQSPPASQGDSKKPPKPPEPPQSPKGEQNAQASTSTGQSAGNPPPAPPAQGAGLLGSQPSTQQSPTIDSWAGQAHKEEERKESRKWLWITGIIFVALIGALGFAILHTYHF